MLAFIGWWLESKNYTNREQVLRTEEPEVVDGAVQIRFDYIYMKKEMTPSIEMRKHTQLIEVDTRVDIKPKDMIYTDKWLKVDNVETYIPENKKSIIRQWPNRRKLLERKRVYLT